MHDDPTFVGPQWTPCWDYYSSKWTVVDWTGAALARKAMCDEHGDFRSEILARQVRELVDQGKEDLRDAVDAALPPPVRFAITMGTILAATAAGLVADQMFLDGAVRKLIRGVASGN